MNCAAPVNVINHREGYKTIRVFDRLSLFISSGQAEVYVIERENVYTSKSSEKFKISEEGSKVKSHNQRLRQKSIFLSHANTWKGQAMFKDKSENQSEQHQLSLEPFTRRTETHEMATRSLLMVSKII